jgi:hypothetical protein
MKLKKEFLQHITDNEAMLVPTGRAGFAGLVRGNRTLGVILGLLAEETTEDAVIAAMKARFDAPEEILARDVRTALQNLRAVGALDE